VEGSRGKTVCSSQLTEGARSAHAHAHAHAHCTLQVGRQPGRG
jgi:hypothetical protein